MYELLMDKSWLSPYFSDKKDGNGDIFHRGEKQLFRLMQPVQSGEHEGLTIFGLLIDALVLMSDVSEKTFFSVKQRNAESQKSTTLFTIKNTFNTSYLNSVDPNMCGNVLKNILLAAIIKIEEEQLHLLIVML